MAGPSLPAQPPCPCLCRPVSPAFPPQVPAGCSFLSRVSPLPSPPILFALCSLSSNRSLSTIESQEKLIQELKQKNLQLQNSLDYLQQTHMSVCKTLSEERDQFSEYQARQEDVQREMRDLKKVTFLANSSSKRLKKRKKKGYPFHRKSILRERNRSKRMRP